MADQMKFRLTPEQVEAARAKLAEAGFPIPGESGAFERDDYRIGYSLTDGALLLELVAKPRFVTLIAVKSRIRGMLAKKGLQSRRE